MKNLLKNIIVPLFLGVTFLVQGLKANSYSDSFELKFHGNILFSSIGTFEESNSNFGYNSTLSKRREYFISIIGKYDRMGCNQVPWISPYLSVSTGYFVAETKHQQSSNYPTRNINGYIETFQYSDTTGYSSIPIIPQLGLIINPWYKIKNLSKLSLSFALGYQFNPILEFLSTSNKIENQIVDNPYLSPIVFHSNTTRYLSKVEAELPKYYLQCGITNFSKFNNKISLGYKLSFSWHPNYFKGLEFSLDIPFFSI